MSMSECYWCEGRSVCPTCDGARGWTAYADEWYECPDCQGTGDCLDCNPLEDEESDDDEQG